MTSTTRRLDSGAPRCAACGAPGKLEAHHLARRANDPVTVLVCKGCHRGYLTPWQRTSSVPVKGTVTEPQRVFSLYVGLLQLIRLQGQRHELPRIVRATRLIESMAVIASGDPTLRPTAGYVPIARPTGTDISSTTACLVGLLPLITNDSRILEYFRDITEGKLRGLTSSRSCYQS